MKLKGKLILSCAALAAVATTAFSTTYAWYTSNTEVKATGLEASTGTSNDSALQISLDGQEWGASVDLGAVVENLTPVQRTEKGTGIPSTFTTQNLAGTTNPVTQRNDGTDEDPEYVDAENATAAANIVQFTLYFRNITIADGDTSPVYIKAASIVNAQAGGVATKLLTDIGSYAQADNSRYRVDLLRALDLEIAAGYTAAVGENDKVECTSSTATTGEMTSLYNLESYAAADTVSALSAGTWDALNYYNTVKGLTGANAATRPAGYAEPTTGFSTVLNSADSLIGTIQSNKQILKTTWTLYLDGWDTACFDACKGQTITFSFEFTTAI